MTAGRTQVRDQVPSVAVPAVRVAVLPPTHSMGVLPGRNTEKITVLVPLASVRSELSVTVEPGVAVVGSVVVETTFGGAVSLPAGGGVHPTATTPMTTQANAS